MDTNERPPADVMPAEVFFDKKCGKKAGSEHDSFYRWCSKPVEKELTVNCTEVGGLKGDCIFKFRFGFDKIKKRYAQLSSSDFDSSSSFRELGLVDPKTGPKLDNSTNTTAPIGQPPIPQDPPRILFWDYKCAYGNKTSGILGESKLSKDVADKIIRTCNQELYGVQESWPLWLILLVIFIILVALTVAGGLFWRYWLRRKVYGRQAGEPASTLGSQWTSAPLSAYSDVSNQSKSSSDKRKKAQASAASQASVSNPSQLPGSLSRTPGSSQQTRGSFQSSAKFLSKLPSRRSTSLHS